MITVRTQVKEIVKETNLGINNISEDFIKRLDEKVKKIVEEACQRAKANGRKTVMGKDI
jgi:histone H3/H4